MTTHTPLRCSFSGMAQRGTNEVVLMDTGNYPSYSNFLNETWKWNGTDWTNTATTLIDANGPLPGRLEMTFVYDGYHVMLFGGRGDSSLRGMFEDTWTWNGTAWTKQSPTTSPVGRFGAKAAFLAGHGTVMFGGCNDVNYLSNDTWVWDGYTALNWTQANPATSPAGRRYHVMAASSTQVIMFGGEGTNSLFNDTWKWDGTNWTQLAPATSPSARSNACMSYDSVNSLFVMFGGANEYDKLAETWTFNGTTWTKQSVTGPNCKLGAQMCFDTQSGKTILFGGIDTSTNYPSNETWAFDGAAMTWTKL